MKSYLSILLDFHNGSRFVFNSNCLRQSSLQLNDQREVPIDMVVGQHIAAVTGEGDMRTVECEDMLTIHDNGTHCKKYR